MNVVPSKKATVYVVTADGSIADIFERSGVFFKTLAYASELIIQENKDGIASDAVSAAIPGATLYMPFAELVDISKEIERLSKERDKMIKEVERVEKKLANQGFIAKAPANVIEEEKAKGVKYRETLKQIEERLESLKK